MVRLLPLLLVLLAALTGCVEAEEDWAFDAKGGGTYQLVVRWNADLWRRIEGVLGAKVMRRFAGRGFPLRSAQVRDGLKGLRGVTVTRLEERDTDTGMREIAVAMRFERLTDLLRWEIIAGRTLRAGPVPKAGKDAPTDPTHASFHMEPIARVPVLDALAALIEAEASPPPKAPKGLRARDPGPLGRLGIQRADGDLVWRMLKPALERARFSVRVKVPGDLVRVGGQDAPSGEREAEFAWDFPALRRAKTDRSVRLRWKLRALDVAPTAKNTGRAR